MAECWLVTAKSWAKDTGGSLPFSSFVYMKFP